MHSHIIFIILNRSQTCTNHHGTHRSLFREDILSKFRLKMVLENYKYHHRVSVKMKMTWKSIQIRIASPQRSHMTLNAHGDPSTALSSTGATFRSPSSKIEIRFLAHPKCKKNNNQNLSSKQGTAVQARKHSRSS